MVALSGPGDAGDLPGDCEEKGSDYGYRHRRQETGS